MAREYGRDRKAVIAVRVTEQEKEQVKQIAANNDISVSDLMRSLFVLFLENPDFFTNKGE